MKFDKFELIGLCLLIFIGVWFTYLSYLYQETQKGEALLSNFKHTELQVILDLKNFGSTNFDNIDVSSTNTQAIEFKKHWAVLLTDTLKSVDAAQDLNKTYDFRSDYINHYIDGLGIVQYLLLTEDQRKSAIKLLDDLNQSI